MEEAHVISCGQYEILVGSGIFQNVFPDLERTLAASRYIVLFDDNVDRLYGDFIRDTFPEAKSLFYTIPPGETVKTREKKEEVEDFMIANHCDRKACIVTVGGGVIGDLGGFIAATYMRGISVVHVPTTLLAMVDSSIGGKTGVDTPVGKNLIGAFHQPSRVYVDTVFLKTLPARELSNGLAEVIKAGAIRSASLFATLEMHSEEIMGCNLAVLLPALCEAIQIKADVVLQDEKEAGLREILNFGHSIGHGIEALLTPTWLHGECVAVGMVKETELARARGVLSPDALSRLIACLEAYRLPVRVPPQCAPADVLGKMAHDKKNKGGVKRVVILRSIGNAGHGTEAVDDTAILMVLTRAVQMVPKGPINGKLHVPGSKSISNRALLMAALGSGVCHIHGLLHSEDTRVMITALQTLGVRIEFAANGAVVVVHGCKGCLEAEGDEVHLGNAGTAARFLCSAVAIPASGTCVLTGSKRMQERPIEDLVQALTDNGVEVTYLARDGCLPVRVTSHGLAGGRIEVGASVSSQYVSSVLLSAPYAREPVHLVLKGEVVSQPYIDMTVSLMAKFGVEVQKRSDGSYIVPNTGYTNPEVFVCEPDASSASYPLALAAITGGCVTVEGLGSASLQGDARFCQILEKMGCVVTQGEDSTMVARDLHKDIAAMDVDMADTTDAFMTAAVLLATAPRGVLSKITGIANQRVKECNRIQAMVTELTKCGVTCRELPAGLEIEGAGREGPATLQTLGAEIECYNDHRIAMSFAVLGALWPNIRIKDKDCVDKTYPAFWDDMNTAFNVRNIAVPYAMATGKTASSAERQSLLVIGMRAAGKTTLGRAAAVVLGYHFLDLDAVLDGKIGAGGIKGLIKSKGWEVFRDLEAEVLAAEVKSHPRGTVISCGGGIVERSENRDLLRSCALPVVWVNRDIADIEAQLVQDETRPQFTEPIREVFARRLPWYIECSTHEFTILRGDMDTERLAHNFSRFARSATRTSLEPLRDNSFFVCMTLPDLEGASLPPALWEGVHAVELRVDLLRSQDAAFVQRQVALLRQTTHLPIIYTVRSKAQGGRFEGTEPEYFALLSLGVRCGCDFIDLESTGWSEGGRLSFLTLREGSRVIGSAHFLRPCKSTSELVSVAGQCWHGGAADIVKVVFTAETLEDCFLVHSARLHVAETEQVRAPVLALCMGAQGRLSRVLNTFMTPVTHPALPVPAAPGQMTVAEILSARALLQTVPVRRFFIFGSPVALSPSPLMHNTGFAALDLPWHYDAVDTSDAAVAAHTLREAGTGGANITIPLKQAIVPLLDVLSPAAYAIGAVNTVIKDERTGALIGDNTDWEGIFRPMRAALQGRARQRAVIIGAGGTSLAAAYALRVLGFSEVYLVNRTVSKAEGVAARFGLLVCADAGALQGVDAVVCTLPPTVMYLAPETLLASRPVVMDVAYLPRRTPLLVQAASAGCVTIEGIEMLLEQGIAAHRLWTMRVPHGDVMRAVVLREYEALVAAQASAQGRAAIARTPDKDEVRRLVRTQTSLL